MYVIPSTVTSVTEHFCTKYISGSGDKTVFEKQSLGWFVVFEGSHEALYFGETKPTFDKGDKVKITFERVT